MNKALLSSQSESWTTPRDLFDTLDERFSFTLDPCCTKQTALCPKFFTKNEDGLTQSWKGERVFMNPPYGRKITDWVKKAYLESLGGALVVGLLPARTDTTWWHGFVQNKGQVYFLKGRLKFGNSQNAAPFPSVIVVWWGQESLFDK